MKRMISILLALALLAPAAYAYDIGAEADTTAAYVYEHTPSPSVGSVGGEWAVTGLARSGYAVPQDYYSSYYSAVSGYVQDNGGVLSRTKYTEFSRVIIALTAIGRSPAAVAGYDLTAPLADLAATTKQGLNGAVWALIALDSGGYIMPRRDAEQATRGRYIETILNRQLPGGGWALSAAADTADTDITAMALTALAPYRARADVDGAIDKALGYLRGALLADGGFDSAETCAQTLIALSALGIPYTDERFICNGKTVLDKLMTYRLPDGSFSHNGKGADMMATEQALLALAALRRQENNEKSLYSISGRGRAAVNGAYNRLLDLN